MKIVFLDTACVAFARRGGTSTEHWEPHCARVAALLERDHELVGRLCELLAFPAGFLFDEAAFEYHRAGMQEFRLKGAAPGNVLRVLHQLFIHGADLIVCHNAPFHKRVLSSIYEDAGLTVPPLPEFFDTMTESAPIVRLKLMSANRWKSPRLSEAYHYFSGGQALPQHYQWDQHGHQQVDMVRAIYDSMTKGS